LKTTATKRDTLLHARHGVGLSPIRTVRVGAEPDARDGEPATPVVGHGTGPGAFGTTGEICLTGRRTGRGGKQLAKVSPVVQEAPSMIWGKTRMRGVLHLDAREQTGSRDATAHDGSLVRLAVGDFVPADGNGRRGLLSDAGRPGLGDEPVLPPSVADLAHGPPGDGG